MRICRSCQNRERTPPARQPRREVATGLFDELAAGLFGRTRLVVEQMTIEPRHLNPVASPTQRGCRAGDPGSAPGSDIRPTLLLSVEAMDKWTTNLILRSLPPTLTKFDPMGCHKCSPSFSFEGVHG